MKHAPFIACIALVAFAFLPRPAATKPTGPLAEVTARMDRADRAEIGRFYRDLRNVTLRDAGKLIPNTIVWRAVYQNSLKMAFDQTPLKGKYDGLDKAIDAEIMRDVGLKPAALTDTLEDGRKVYEAIAQNCGRVEAACE